MSLTSKSIKTLVTVGLAAVGSVAILGERASAVSLVPSVEGEVCVTGVTALGSCITLASPVASVESLTDATSGTKSRLFVDHLSTANTYGANSNPEQVKFQAGDVGTVPAGFWFRPSERTLLSNGTFDNEEQGQLEVGTFKFNFTSTIAQLTIRYFDTESNPSTGVPNTGFYASTLQTDGTLIGGTNPVPSGSNGNIYTQTWSNVSYITLKLGNDTSSRTGDGVDFQVDAVPEPLTMLGAGTALGFGTFFKRRLAKKENKK